MKTYTILKGCHYSNFMPCFKFLNEIIEFTGTFEFDKSCKYEINEKSCVNKLFGFCFGFGVHKDSVRFGWTYNNDIEKILIWSYVYKNGKLHKHEIKHFDVETQHKYKIKVQRIEPIEQNKRHSYNIHLYIDDDLYDICKLSTNRLIITTLGPYFGGNTKAPHKMKIRKY